MNFQASFFIFILVIKALDKVCLNYEETFIIIVNPAYSFLRLKKNKILVLLSYWYLFTYLCSSL